MNVEKIEKLPPPPGVIGSLRSGFDVVSSHVWLILLPVLLDVYLWLGPRLSVGNVYAALIATWVDVFKPLPEATAQAIPGLVDQIGRLHWASWIRTLPIGIPSLETFTLPETFPLQTPLGEQNVVQATSNLQLVGWVALFTLLGWIGGGIYFRWVSVTTLGVGEAGISLSRAIVQTILLSIAWSIGLIMLFVPISLIIGLFTLINPALGNAVLFILLILSYWLIVPLFFMPHGIFTRRQNALNSILSSLRMSRFTLPTSGIFIFSGFLLTRGLGYLWSVPENDSWLTLVGIAGHGFIATAWLAASFVYYRDMNLWLQHVFEKMQQKQGMPTQQA